MAQNISLMGANYPSVPAVTLPKTGGGTATFTDTSDTTAVASDVAQGKYFYSASGVKTEGTASGGGGTETIIVPEQTITVSSSYTQIQFNKPLVEGDEYTYTVNGSTGTTTCVNMYGSLLCQIYINGGYVYFDYSSPNMYFDVNSSSQYGTYTIKLTQQSGGGGGSTLIEKSITANGTYNASDDDADGYSKVTVNVSGGSSKNFQVSNTEVRLGNRTTLSDTGLTLTVAETGTYNVYWSAFRSNTSSGYTWGTQLYIGSNAYGSANTSWSNSYNQINKLTGVSLTKNQVLHVYGQTRSGNSYYICCSNLILEQTA